MTSTRNGLRRSVVIGLLTAVAACAVAVGDDRPNILLILSDDHSAPHVGCYPDGENCRRFDLTPHLDALAAEGMRFDRTYSAAPQCELCSRGESTCLSSSAGRARSLPDRTATRC
jgi:hypothetical protein